MDLRHIPDGTLVYFTTSEWGTSGEGARIESYVEKVAIFLVSVDLHAILSRYREEHPEKDQLMDRFDSAAGFLTFLKDGGCIEHVPAEEISLGILGNLPEWYIK